MKLIHSFHAPRVLCTLFILSALLGGSSAFAHDDKAKSDEGEKEETEEPVTHLFGNHICPVMGEAVDPKSFVEYRDEENDVYARIYVCCPGCDKKVEKKIAELYKTLYRTDEKTGKEIEPVDLKNDKCPMSGEPVLPDVSLEYNGMIIHFCCPGCGQDFLKDPEAKLKEIHPEADKFKFEPPAGSGSSKDEEGKEEKEEKKDS